MKVDIIVSSIFVFVMGFLMAFGLFYTEKPQSSKEGRVWACFQTGDTMECQFTSHYFTEKKFFRVKEIKK